MDELNDNKIENIFFKIVLNNQQLKTEIRKIYNIINQQKISDDDKKIINEKVFGIGLLKKDEDIDKIIDNLREEDINNKLFYKLIFKIIESTFNIEDITHIYFLVSYKKEEIETDLIYFFRDIFELITKTIDKKLKNNRSLLELFSSDYLSDEERKNALNEIDILFNQLTEEIINSDEIKNIKDKIQKEIDRKIKLSNLK